jgi:hypothetical protein
MRKLFRTVARGTHSDVQAIAYGSMAVVLSVAVIALVHVL